MPPRVSRTTVKEQSAGMYTEIWFFMGNLLFLYWYNYLLKGISSTEARRVPMALLILMSPL